MFLQLYCLHLTKNFKDFVTNTNIRHQSCICRPYLGDLKYLNHRSKDFYFFMYIFGWFSQEFLLESYRYACLDNPASASDNLIGSDFYRLHVSSDLDGFRGALKREVFFHTFLCVLA